MRLSQSLPWMTTLIMPIALGLIFFYAPEEASQGMVQKIFYIHLGAVAAMYIALFAGMLFAAIFLSSKIRWSDRLSQACVEVGYLFTTIVLLTGTIWAKPIWGAWWNWEARLTTTLLIWLIYSAYILLRWNSATERGLKMATTVLAIVGFLDVPLIHYSVKFFRGVHPRVITEGGIAPQMMFMVIFSMIACLLLAATLVELRYSILKLADWHGSKGKV